VQLQYARPFRTRHPVCYYGVMLVLDPFAPAPPPPGQLALLRVSRRAMATTFEVAIPYGTPNALPAAEAAIDLIDELEEQMTVYRDSSEVSRLNAAGRADWIEPQLFALLQRCTTLTRETEGAFDVACGALVKCWGFYKREGRIPTGSELNGAMARTGFRHVSLNAETRAVRFTRPGVELNLGAVGKGYALDRAAELLCNGFGIRSALLHAGGSSVRAVGCPPTDFRGWRVSIRHPHDDRRTLGSVFLDDEALGTSADTYQHFEYNGKRYGHVLDPRTGRPVGGTRSASCIAPTAADADALSTAFFVGGATWTADYLRTRGHLRAVLLADADTPQTFHLSAAKYDPPEARANPGSDAGGDW
jgi:thiamine biosynthesis lipoprotein